jgi:rhamnogalacturonan endolyase
MKEPVERRRFLRGAVTIGAAATAAPLLASRAFAATSFGLTSSGGYYVVSTGAGLVFKVNQSTGGISSFVYNGTELQPSGTNESHVESGLGAPAVSGTVNGDYIIVTATTNTWYGSGTLIHYFVVVNGQNNVYMATYTNGGGELRWIQYLNRTTLPTFDTAADIEGGTAIESTDIYEVSGQTRSKYYSNRQAQDLTVRGVTGSSIGVFMDYGNRESSSGGPFFRDIEQQGTDASIELYNYMFSAHNQTESQRLGVLYGPYVLMVGGTGTPAAPDTSFMSSLGLTGYVANSGRGWVVGAVSGATNPVVGWANSTAQYWTTPSSNGDFSSPMMKPGTYTQTLYQGELAVATRTVTVTAGTETTGQNLSSTWTTPASPIFRIGSWDGTPSGLLNAGNVTYMHPSDARMASWGPATFTVGTSTEGEFPAYQFKAENNPSTIKFTLTSSQVAARTVRIGISAAYANGRPQITVNSWTSSVPSASTQPSSRSLTIGTYRGNNALFTYDVPASAFVTGTNTMTIAVASGSAGLGGYLTPAVSYDCIEMY